MSRDKDISAISSLKTMFIGNYPISRIIDNKCADMLKPAGFDVVGDMVCIATSSKEAARHFAASRWADNWIASLLELPHAERGRAAKRFAGVTAKYIMIPAFYFKETANVQNQI